MTDVLIAVALVLVAATATAAVANRDPLGQALVLSFLGVALALLFTFVQAPDVALSQLAVGSAVTPLMIVLAVRKVKRGPTREPEQDPRRTGGDPGAERASGDRGADRTAGDRAADRTAGGWAAGRTAGGRGANPPDVANPADYGKGERR